MRVSNLSLKNNIVYNLHKNNHNLLKTEKQLGSGNRIFKVSDDPANAIATIYSKVRINQIDQYVANSENARDKIKITYDKISTVTEILHRVKELTVAGANSTFSDLDRIYMATEIEELLGEVVALANSSYEDNFIFSGNKGQVRPFNVSQSLSPDLGKKVITAVHYNGDQFNQEIEIDRNEKVGYTLKGNEVFWAENHLLVSLTDLGNYVVSNEQLVKIDSYPVVISPGDNLDVIINKINANVPSVQASRKVLPTGEEVISLLSRYPHQMALEDVNGGNLLRDLGLIVEGENGDVPFNNFHPNTLEHGGSLFDVLIRLRNNLIDNNVEDLSGKALIGLQLGLENLLKNQAKISALGTRLESVIKDLSIEKVSLIERISKKQDVDVAEASINFNELNYLHRLSLQTASKYIRPSLLDFL